KAADLRNPEAMYRMAMFLLEGRATPKNPSRARELLDMAAKYEYPNAATALKTFFPDSATP
ncbi:MAG: SEL1-like repeat protein, partial [Lentisphaerae bacterium]|nr:SEL1-like repeat protein [Lentisphaerota bacterium]